MYQGFRRTAVPAQAAQQLETTTIPAPTRGIIQDENLTFMQPGAAVVCDNWKPTLSGVSLRGGCDRWCVLPETTPVLSGFRYASGNNQSMFAANATKLYNVTTSAPVLVQGGQASGNYCASQLANQGGDFLLALNDAGDYPLRFDGTTWTQLNAGQINGPAGSNVVNGKNLTYVTKYRNRWFFIEASSMNAWYLPLNAIQGTLAMIPLSGAATKGGKLLFCASWSIDAGDGIDDKLVFCTDLGELLIFTGGDPSNAANWSQEGRYSIAPPMGMNAWLPLGGDLLIATTQGIIPTSASITKSSEELELAAITRTIKPMWRDEVNAKTQWPWTLHNWESYGGIFVTWPGSTPGYCAVVNAATGAWCRFVGYDATCWMRLRDDMFFGTQGGIVMQADRTGYDDGQPYVATLVGGWEMFQAPSQTITWHQARASFSASQGQPFAPQLSATADYVVTIPAPPPAGPDPGTPDVWDEGLWGPDQGPPPPPVPSPADRAQYAQWDQASISTPVVRNTGWVSIGVTGYSLAPVVQVTVAQQAKPVVDLISIAATFERCGINV
ncbi:MAG TPA: hypothetical protein VHT00_14275 [Stellaceae bacterium]|jgi:hypothetical protein|nr:hypothetical protein [Stellaceae bacterium]